MAKMTQAEFRKLVRKLTLEYVADTDSTDENPRKEDHADPTAKAWDLGLDEADNEWRKDTWNDELPRADEPDPTPLDYQNEDFEEMQMLRWLYSHGDDGHLDVYDSDSGSDLAGGRGGKTLRRLLKLKDIHIDDMRDMYLLTKKGMARVENDPGDEEPDLEEVDHADPTAKTWDSGLDEATSPPEWSVQGSTAYGNDAEVRLQGKDMYVRIDQQHSGVAEAIPVDVIVQLLASSGYSVTKNKS